MKKIIKNALAIVLLGLMLFSTISFALINSVSALTIDSVAIANSLQPGKTTGITIGLENDADEDIEDVSVILDLREVPFAPFDSSSEYSIEEIEEDEREFAEFRIIALNNAKAGIYKIPVLITYTQEGKERTKNSLISLVVDSKPELDVSVEEGLLLKGKDNEFVIKVINKGLSDARFVELEIGSGQYELLTAKKQYIGDVDSDDFETVRVSAFFNNNVGNIVNVPVTIVYKDDLNQGYREEFNVGLDIYTESRAVELGLMEKDSTGSYIFGVVLVVILYIVYRRLKRKLKQKRAN